jgi:hypothetical protein
MGTSSHTTDTGLNAFETLFLRGLAVSAGWIVAASGVYLVWQFPAWLAWASVLAAIVVFGYWSWPVIRGWRMTRSVKIGTGWPLALVAIATDALIIGTLFLVRTDEGIISPWQVVPLGIFLLFILATLFVLLALPRMHRSWALPLAIVHTFCAYSVSLLVYKLGFGFDPFVHEAATQYIVDHGLITPKQPFYTGQYVLVAAIHHITRLSIGFIQPILVPALASILLPIALAFHDRGDDVGARTCPYEIFWVLPFAYFTFTVPFNLAMLGFILCLFLLWNERADARVARVLISLATLAIHPLIGIPCVILVTMRELSRYASAYAFPLTLFATIIGLYGSLAVYAMRNEGSLIFPSFEEWASIFHMLFAPSFEIFPVTSWWSILYLLYFLLPWVLIALGTIGLVSAWRNARSSITLLPVASMIGVAVAAILSAATLRYQNIIGHEQFEFALRLISLLPWIVAPGLLATTYHVTRNAYQQVLSTIGLAVLVTAVWHVSYPQLNRVMHVFSPGVSRTDVLTVEAIEQLADGEPYVALVPQLTSAAALRRIGFERSIATVDGEMYPYAIPTGGYLYRRYLDLFEGRDVKLVVEEAQAYAKSQRIFVAVPISWDTGELDEALKKIAKERVLIDESMQVYLIANPAP